MDIKEAPTETGKLASKGLHESAAREEEKTENRKGSDLAKGKDRFEERSRSSDGHSAGEKQRD